MRGTFAPERLASERPIAIACLRLFTLRPLPDFNFPRFSLCISFSTDLDAFGLYFRPLDFFRDDDELELRLERAEVLRDLLLLEDELERDFFVAAIRFSLRKFRRCRQMRGCAPARDESFRNVVHLKNCLL